MATVVAFHAHPDDEVLLSGGTLAKLAADGHRVVIVVACSVPMEGAGARGSERLGQLQQSATELGAARVVHLGYADSGRGPVLYPDPPGYVRFVRADVTEAAGRLADVLRAEQADLLLSYDPRGGYGHPDHVKVHEVGRGRGRADWRARARSHRPEGADEPRVHGGPVAAPGRPAQPGRDPDRLHAAGGDHAPRPRLPVRAAEAAWR